MSREFVDAIVSGNNIGAEEVLKSPDGSRKIKIFYSKAFLNPTLLSSNKDQRVKTHQRGILV